MIKITFTGTQLSLLFTGLINRGTMQVYIDGSLVDTINQYSSTLTWQNRWDSAFANAGENLVLGYLNIDPVNKGFLDTEKGNAVKSWMTSAMPALLSLMFGE
jgi:hypothetical protein